MVTKLLPYIVTVTQGEYSIKEQYNIIGKIISEFQVKCEGDTSTYSELIFLRH